MLSDLTWFLFFILKDSTPKNKNSVIIYCLSKSYAVFYFILFFKKNCETQTNDKSFWSHKIFLPGTFIILLTGDKTLATLTCTIEII